MFMFGRLNGVRMSVPPKAIYSVCTISMDILGFSRNRKIHNKIYVKPQNNSQKRRKMLKDSDFLISKCTTKLQEPKQCGGGTKAAIEKNEIAQK